MTKLIGIRSLYESMLHLTTDFSELIPSLKQQSIFFDSVGFLGLTGGSPFDPILDYITKKQRTEIEWLRENKIISDVNYPDEVAPKEVESQFLRYLSDIGMGDNYWKFFSPIIKESYKSVETYVKEMQKLRLDGGGENLIPLLENLPDRLTNKDIKSEEANQILKKTTYYIENAVEATSSFGKKQLMREAIIARFVSVKMMYFDNVDTLSLIPNYEFSEIPATRKSHVARVVIKKLPVPDETTSWEQILDFRNDPNNQSALLALRRWIRKTASEHIPAIEIEEELEWLLNEYEQNLKLHKIKANNSLIEVWVKSPLEVLENLVTLKFSKLTDPLFAVRKRKISLLEAELQAPGKEVAYIIKAQNQFNNH